MAARVIWKGSISFGLVHIPVALYSAEQRDELHFSMLDRRDGGQVGYKRVNKSTGKEVPWEHVVKGYEYDKGEYVMLEDEDFQQANVKATQSVEIMSFVNGDEIPFLYYNRPYYLEPINKGEKVYALLRETLRDTGKVGVAKVVLREREHLAALIVQEDMLVLELLRFPYELRDTEQFAVPTGKPADLGISKKELDMAQRLVEDMSEPWAADRYHDDYRDDLLRLIEQKVSKGTVKRAPEGSGDAPKSADVIDLMALLKRSVEQQDKGAKTRGKSRSSKKAARKKTASKKKATARGRKRAAQ